MRKGPQIISQFTLYDYIIHCIELSDLKSVKRGKDNITPKKMLGL